MFISGQKQYAIIDMVNKITKGRLSFGFGYEDTSESEPTPENNMIDCELIPLTETTLGELTVDEFINSKKPIIIDGSFSSWEDKEIAPTLSLLNSVSPNDCGTLMATIIISEGLASTKFKVSFAESHIKTNLTDNAGILDDNGEGSFRIQASGGGGTPARFSIYPDGHQDFIEAHIEIIIDKTSF
jgi:hypothetical protein